MKRGGGIRYTFVIKYTNYNLPMLYKQKKNGQGKKGMEITKYFKHLIE